MFFKRKKKACGGFIDLTRVLLVGQEPDNMHKKCKKIDMLGKHAHDIKVSYGKGHNNSGQESRCRLSG